MCVHVVLVLGPRRAREMEREVQAVRERLLVSEQRCASVSEELQATRGEALQASARQRLEAQALQLQNQGELVEMRRGFQEQVGGNPVGRRAQSAGGTTLAGRVSLGTDAHDTVYVRLVPQKHITMLYVA